MEVVSIISAISLGTLVATTPTALAQDTAPEPQEKTLNYEKWTLRCVNADSGTRCEVNQVATVTNQENNTRQQIMRVSLGRDAAGTEVLRIVLPLGTNIGRGVTFDVSPLLTLDTLSFSYCLSDGCLIVIPVNSGMLAEMRTGGQGNVNIYLLNAPNEINLPVDFTGFNEAYAAFLAE